MTEGGRDCPLSVLAFEPFDDGSHRAVRASIERYSRHRWTWLTLPGRSWNWRMRLASVTFAEQVRAMPAGVRGGFDMVFATSLMSLADLIALLPASLRALPSVLLMHENQAAYPYQQRTAHERQRDVHFALTNLTSILAADRVLWNSAWNRDSFLAGVADILRHAPDQPPADPEATIRAKSDVWWLPVDVGDAGDGHAGRAVARSIPGAGDVQRVVWPHRWEHDKGPATLLHLARRYSERWNLRWTILGGSYRRVPEALTAFERAFADRIDWMGFEPDRAKYLDRVAGCDWVLSTARHEFFGLAVVEALHLGCLPWLPARLSYRELLPDCARRLHPGASRERLAGVRESIRVHLRATEARRSVAHLDDHLDGVGPGVVRGAGRP
jgi:hypothetical protein